MRLPVYERKPASLLTLVNDQWALVLPLIPGVGRFVRTVAQQEASDQHAWLNTVLTETQLRAERLVSDTRYNLVYIHFPIPHPPAVDGNPSVVRGYFDNLALVDRSIAGIRAAMERSGTWNTSAFIVTADHPFRVFHWKRQPEWGTPDERVTDGKTRPYVPLVIKLPGQTSKIPVEAPVYSVLVHDVVLEYLNGKLSTHAELADWLQRNRNRWGPPALPKHASPPGDSQRAAVAGDRM